MTFTVAVQLIRQYMACCARYSYSLYVNGVQPLREIGGQAVNDRFIESTEVHGATDSINYRIRVRARIRRCMEH